MKKTILSAVVVALVSFTVARAAYAHDGWVQSNVARVTVGDMVYLDMQFGNHGNMHRDYKIYGSKWDVTKSTFTLHSPNNQALNFRDSVIDVGQDEAKIVGGVPYTDKNGYLAASFQATQKGIYIADVRQDMVVSYAPERSIKCTKAIVGAVNSSMKSNTTLTGFDKKLDQVLEIIPLEDPTTLAVGDTLPFRVLFKGSPLPDAEVSVIPRGEALPPMGTPNPYDFMTDVKGKASFNFEEANYHLIVVHVETDESGFMDGKPYSFTKYSAALTVIIGPARDQAASLTELSTPEQAKSNLLTSAFHQALMVFNKISLYLKANAFLSRS